MPTAKKSKASSDKPRQPDDVVRESAGVYRSGDGRFEVRQSQASWYLVDSKQANEFGQELIHGPFGSLKVARGAMSGARELKPLLRSLPRPKRGRTAKKKPPPPPETWIDGLPKREAGDVRRLIRAIEREGVQDAEALVRRSRGQDEAILATAVIERLLEELVNEQPEDQRDRARALVSRTAQILTQQGSATSPPLPRWATVEVADGAKPARTIRLR